VSNSKTFDNSGAPSRCNGLEKNEVENPERAFDFPDQIGGVTWAGGEDGE